MKLTGTAEEKAIRWAGKTLRIRPDESKAAILMRMGTWKVVSGGRYTVQASDTLVRIDERDEEKQRIDTATYNWQDFLTRLRDAQAGHQMSLFEMMEGGDVEWPTT